MLFYFICFIINSNIIKLLGVVNLRIISGSLRGLNLYTLEGTATRPTADRVKEALFSSLTPYLRDSVVLDAFSGSGALALEALSRGAKEAVLCENNKEAFKICEKNIEKAKLKDRTSLLFTDALAYIKNTDKIFDIIFLDPPYGAGLYEGFLTLAKDKLKDNGIIVAEYEEAHTPKVPEGFIVTKQKRYGRCNLLYLSGVEKT